MPLFDGSLKNVGIVRNAAIQGSYTQRKSGESLKSKGKSEKIRGN